MGNYKFRLSDMIPNAWFYKLKEMGAKGGRDTNNNNNSNNNNSLKKKPPKPKESYSPLPLIPASTKLSPKQVPHSPTTHNLHNNPYPRKSYYFSRELLRNDNLALLNSPDPPRRSSKHRTRRRTSTSPKRVSSSSVSAGCSCRSSSHRATKPVGNNSPPEKDPLLSSDEGSTITTEDQETEARPASLVFRPELVRSDRLLVTHSFDQMLSCTKNIESDSSNNIVIDVQPESTQVTNPPPLSEKDLPPIVTKQVTKVEEKKSTANRFKPGLVDTRVNDPRTAMEEEKKPNKKERGNYPKEVITAPSRIKQRTRSAGSTNSHNSNTTHSPGIRLRVNSPRIAAGRRSFHQVQGSSRKSLSLSSTTTTSGSSRSSSSSSRRSLSASSLAVVKSSFDPQRDFRESMVEMIVENNLRGSKDLEDLLACYLSLNADEYHDLIIKVFKQIWFDLTRTCKPQVNTIK